MMVRAILSHPESYLKAMTTIQVRTPDGPCFKLAPDPNRLIVDASGDGPDATVEGISGYYD